MRQQKGGTYMYMLWFNFILGLIFISLCFKLIIIYYHAQKQRKIKIKPRIKLNHNIYVVTEQKAEIFLALYCFIVEPTSVQQINFNLEGNFFNEIAFSSSMKACELTE